MQSSNPALLNNPFAGFGSVSRANTMTIPGTVAKTGILLLLVMLPAAWTWRMLLQGNTAAVQGWMIGGAIAGFILALVTVFKMDWAPITAPLYAVAEGLFLGGISGAFESSYPGIVVRAVGLSIATLLCMLVAYQTGLIRATDKFKLGVFAATGGIALVYLVTIVLGFFGINVGFVTGNSLFSILFSVFVVVIAALNFVIDFDFIEQGTRRGAPKYMEWYGAFALMVTLIWLYIEILRLLAKINDRK